MLLPQAQHQTLHIPLARWRGLLNFPTTRCNDRSITGLLIQPSIPFVEGASSLCLGRLSNGISSELVAHIIACKCN